MYNATVNFLFLFGEMGVLGESTHCIFGTTLLILLSVTSFLPYSCNPLCASSHLGSPLVRKASSANPELPRAVSVERGGVWTRCGLISTRRTVSWKVACSYGICAMMTFSTHFLYSLFLTVPFVTIMRLQCDCASLCSPGVFNPRPVDWFSAARPDDFFRSLGAIFPVAMKMKVRKRNGLNRLF
jgi:hypothetical protein